MPVKGRLSSMIFSSRKGKFEIACSLWKKHYIDETRKQHRQEDVITMYCLLPTQ